MNNRQKKKLATQQYNSAYVRKQIASDYAILRDGREALNNRTTEAKGRKAFTPDGYIET